MKKVRQLVKSIFEDKSHNVVLAQKPNMPLIGWALFTVAAAVLSDGKLQMASQLLALGFILIWAWLEIFQGVNLFRKMLGAIVIVMVICSRLG